MDGAGFAIESSAAVDRALVAVDRMERRDDTGVSKLSAVVVLCEAGEMVNAAALVMDKRETIAEIFMVLDDDKIRCDMI